MLTYTSPSDSVFVSPTQSEKPWLWLILCALWLLPGLVGHDPWKPAENQSVAVISHFLQGGHWSLPMLAGMPYLEQAPLYYWSAALLGQVLGWFGLALHDAARLTTGLWMLLAMWGIGLAGRELHGRKQGRVAIVVLVGSIGLLLWGHHASPAILALTAFAWQLYALALVRRRPLPAGGLLGLSWLVLLLGATWGEALLAMMLAVLLASFSAWRSAGFLAALLTAFTIALPLGLLWPLSLYQHAPDVFALWWREHSLGLYGGVAQLRFFHEPGYLPSIVVWFAFPALPLALWSLWTFRRTLLTPRWILLLLQVVLIAFWLLLAGDLGESQALLLLAPLAVLAAAGVDDLRRSAASSLYWFGVTTFGALAIALWAAWLGMQFDGPAILVDALHKRSPTYVPQIGLGVLFALGISVAWCYALTDKHGLGRRAVTNWACGLTLVWGLLAGLWQPWLDATKSYRYVGLGLQLAAKAYPGCIAASGVGEAQMAGIAYFSGLDIRAEHADAAQCPLILRSTEGGAEEQLLWMGSRPGESGETSYLYRK